MRAVGAPNPTAMSSLTADHSISKNLRNGRRETVSLLGMDTAEITQFLTAMGQKPYRGRQAAAWIYKHRAHSFTEMTDLPLGLREKLAQTACVGRGAVVSERRSEDGTVKLLVQWSDGNAVETVYLPYAGRDSVCVSTQVGCAAACVFCATGLMGFRGNLTPGEIVDQVLHAQDLAVREQGEGARISNIVFMGMGEPLLNLSAVVKAVRLINQELGISMRNLTVSTVGITPAIRRLAQHRFQFTLAVSLHAPTQELRERIVPLAKRYPLDNLLRACHEYAEITSRRVTFEYVLIDGVNDAVEHARCLAGLIRGELAHVNLIPLNPCPDLPEFRPPPRERVLRFQQEVERGGVRTTLRIPRGQDIEAACGQLRRTLDGLGRKVSR
ncbi:MAG: 23S rRNA (adenine(2503)-C(2))-methyltransferase RlmN [Armatimonadota bacterium]